MIRRLLLVLLAALLFGVVFTSGAVELRVRDGNRFQLRVAVTESFNVADDVLPWTFSGRISGGADSGLEPLEFVCALDRVKECNRAQEGRLVLVRGEIRSTDRGVQFLVRNVNIVGSV